MFIFKCLFHYTYLYITFLSCGLWFSNKCNNLDCHLYQPSFQYIYYNELFSKTSPKDFSFKTFTNLNKLTRKKKKPALKHNLSFLYFLLVVCGFWTKLMLLFFPSPFLRMFSLTNSFSGHAHLVWAINSTHNPKKAYILNHRVRKKIVSLNMQTRQKSKVNQTPHLLHDVGGAIFKAQQEDAFPLVSYFL